MKNLFKFTFKLLILLFVPIFFSIVGFIGVVGLLAYVAYNNVAAMLNFEIDSLVSIILIVGLVFGGGVFGFIGIKTAYLLMHRLKLVDDRELLIELGLELDATNQSTGCAREKGAGANML